MSKGQIPNTWRCARCKTDFSLFKLAGSKYVYIGGRRRRICSGCAQC